MKVLICKFCLENGIEKNVNAILQAEKKLSGVKVFCLTEVIKKRLEAEGIISEIFPEFELPDSKDEANCELAYRLSDELRASVEAKEELKLSGINVLTMEHSFIEYLHAIRFSNLLRLVSNRKLETVVLVLTNPHTSWLKDINTKRIKTLRYGSHALRIQTAIRLCRRRLTQVVLIFGVLRGLLIKVNLRKNLRPAQNAAQRPLRALFVVATALYARPALSISEVCKKMGMTPRLATDDMTLLPVLQNSGFDYSIKPLFSINAFISLVRHRRLLRRLRQHIIAFYSVRPDEFSAEYLCQETILANLPDIYCQAVSGISYINRLLNGYSPDIVCVMPQASFLQQLTYDLAKKRGVPTIACSAAWETGTSSAFRKHLHADKLATAGEKMRKMYMDSGLEPDRVIATGIAHFDGLFKRDAEQDRLTLQNLGINRDERFAIFITDNLPMAESEALLTCVIDAVLTIDGLSLVVKVHPKEEEAPFQEIISRYHSDKLKVFKDIDLYALLTNCQLVISKGSTAALEAMIIDKPVIIFDLGGMPVSLPYVDDGAAIGVYQKEELKPAILKMLSDNETKIRFAVKRDEFVRNWAHNRDGKASERIVILMKEMINSRR